MRSILISLILGFALLAACSKDQVNEPNPGESVLEVRQVFNLKTFDPETGATTAYYNLRENKRIDKNEANSQNWDIAFHRTTVYANANALGGGNGGILALTKIDFSNVEEAPASGYSDKLSGMEDGWYNYNFQTHEITPKPGYVIVVKCADGKYAKVQILSYYNGYPDNIPAKPEDREDRYYSFKYAVQLDGSRDLR